MQGTAADLIKLSMVEVQQVLDDEQRATKMIMQVHDELVFEVPEAEVDWVEAEVPRLMAGVAAAQGAAAGRGRRRARTGTRRTERDGEVVAAQAASIAYACRRGSPTRP